MSAAATYIHLRVHSEYSLLEGAIRLKKLPALCAQMGMPAVALTDSNNMFAALEFSVAASEAGLQPIIGCQVDLHYNDSQTAQIARAPLIRPAPLVLLAQSERGYENLMLLNSCLYLRGDGQPAHVTLQDLATHSEGVICLTGGPDGPLGRLLGTGQLPAAEGLLRALKDRFGNCLYVELQRHWAENYPGVLR